MVFRRNILRWFPLAILALCLILFFYFHLYSYLDFSTLKQHRQELLQWNRQHYLLAVIGYLVIYQLAVAVSIPGAVYLTLLGGFLFGILAGTVYTVIGATLGSVWLFLAVNTALGNFFAHRSQKWIHKMRQGFVDNAFNYLLVLRLVPIFPFWVVNIVPALLGVSLKIFFWTTLIGIIPGSLVYTMLGNGLGHILDVGQTPQLTIIFKPFILIPLLALALLSLLPVIYKHFKGKSHVKRD